MIKRGDTKNLTLPSVSGLISNPSFMYSPFLLLPDTKYRFCGIEVSSDSLCKSFCRIGT